MPPQQEMTPSKCNEQLYAKEEITCTKLEYNRDIRATIDLAVVRQQDLGNDELRDFAKAELIRLDAVHGYLVR